MLMCVVQSTRCIVHVVPESSQVDPLHCLAQLQVGDHQDPGGAGSGDCTAALLLLGARIHGQEASRSLNKF